MKNAKVVIGANWGDEGKGNLTNFLCENDFRTTAPVLNVRFNGGAQAGHTVDRGLNDSRRHVFHHFGSGSFNPNVATFLSKDFIVNPIIFEQELRELQRKGVFPHVYIDSAARLTTPYDMMINQMAEEARGTARHGSCGLGINETLQRNKALYHGENNDKILYEPLSASIKSAGDIKLIESRLATILSEWVPGRMEMLGLKFGENVGEEWRKRIYSTAIVKRYLETLQTVRYNAIFLDDHRELFERYQSRIVMEGAQGLLLDQHHRFFPHVTHSNTGIKNPLALAERAKLPGLDVIYITRCYATRHGAGPFPHEVPGLSYPDPTNVPNDWQGTLRFGILDLDLLRDTIAEDLANVPDGMTVNSSLAVTCLDQIKSNIPYVRDGAVEHASTTLEFLSAVRAHVGLPIGYCSFGPNDIFKQADLFNPAAKLT